MYALDFTTLRSAVEELLRRVGDIKASGDKEAAITLRTTYCYEDALKKEIDERTEHIPLSRALVFPELQHDGEKYIASLTCPAFTEQGKLKKRYQFDGR
jgi:hypothetical protein